MTSSTAGLIRSDGNAICKLIVFDARHRETAAEGRAEDQPPVRPRRRPRRSNTSSSAAGGWLHQWTPLNPPTGLATELVPTGGEEQCWKGEKLRRQQLHQSASSSSSSTGNSAV